MAASSSKKVVYAALAGNSLIAVTKFTATALTGSSAMFSEAIHSVVDTGNQLLLLHGIKRAARPADTAHPFGYGMELYFWTFVVAILIFGLGAGLAFYKGVIQVLDPHPITDANINYLVLVIAMVFEAGAWWIAFKEFRKTKGRLGFLAAVRVSKDPTVFTVLFEDSAAMLGLVAAFTGIAVGEALDMPVLDGVASVVIGLILATTAAALAFECKGLLIGEGARGDVVAGIREIVSRDRRAIRLNELLTMHLGPNDVLLNLSLDFGRELSADQVEEAVSDLERRIKAEFSEITRVFIEAQSWTAHARSQTDSRAEEPDQGA